MSSFTTPEFIALGSSISVLLVLGSAVQGFLLLVMMHPEFRDFELTSYFLNIVISNIVVIIVDFPAIAGAAWSEKKLLSPVHCQVVGFLTGVGSITTFFTITLCIIKIHRKVNVAELLNNANCLSLQYNTIKTLTASWMCAIVTMTPPLFGWGSFATESGGAVCAPNWRDKSVAGRVYLATLAILAFGVPVTICTTLLMKTYKKIQRFPVFSAETREQQRKWKEIFNVAFISFAAFFLSWTPYCICAMINVFGGSEMFDRERSFIPGVFAKASSVHNPILPLLFSKRFRKVVVNVLRLFFQRASTDNILEVPDNVRSARLNGLDAVAEGSENLEEARDTSRHTSRHSETGV